MSLLFCDGFDHYTATLDKYEYASYHSSGGIGSGGRFGGNALKVVSSAGFSSVRKYLPAGATWVVGFAINPVSIWGGDYRGQSIFSVMDAIGSVTHMTLRILPGNVLAVYRASTELGRSTISIIPNGYQYVEIKFTISDTVGSVEVRLNGTSVITLSGVNTRNGGSATANGFSFESVLVNGSWDTAASYYDDIYICDDSGSVNNDFLGDIRVSALVPTGDGTYTQFTPSTGGNYQNVDDESPDGDTTYNSDNAVGHVDSFAMSSLPSSAGLVLGVQTLVAARKDDAGERSMGTVQRSGSTDTEGAGVPLLVGYRYIRDVYDINPATGVAYTVGEVNALEVGYKVTA